MNHMLFCRMLTFALIGGLVAELRAEAPSTEVPQKTDIPAQLSVSQVRDNIRAYYATLKALEVKYDEHTVPINFDGELLTNVAHHFAFKGEKRLNSLVPQKESAKTATGYVLAFNEQHQENYTPQFKTATIDDGKQPMLDIDGYSLALGIPLADRERATAPTSSFFLPYALDVGKWTLRPQLESINGSNCYVLDSPKGQSIWVDPELGFAMRMRQIRYVLQDVPVNQWPMDICYRYSEFKKCDDETWLPMQISIDNYVSTRAPANMWNKLEYSKVLRAVTPPNVNSNVSDKLFSLSYPPGTEIRDSVSHRYYRIGKQHEELDIVVRRSTDLLATSDYKSKIFIGVNVLIVICLAIIIGYRILRKRRSRT
jgi:hypothetical protein